MSFIPDRATALLPFRPSAEAQPLRVGIVGNSSHSAPWIEALTEFLGALPRIEAHIFAAPAPANDNEKRPPWLTARLYDASRQRFDPFDGGPGSYPPFDSSDKSDLLLWLADAKPSDVSPCSLAEHGVLTLALGRYHEAIPFWKESSRDQVTSETTLFWHDSSFGLGRPVRVAETSTEQGLYFTASAEEAVTAAIRLFAGLVLELQRDAARCKQRLRRVPELKVPGSPGAGYPSTLEAGRFIARKLARSAYRRWTTRGKEARWFVALRANCGSTIASPGTPDLSGFHKIPLPPGIGAMADPFLYESGGRTWLLFEDVPPHSSRGRIASIEVREDETHSEAEVVLQRDYHLSYPCVIESKGELYLMPESSEARCVELFRFRRFPSALELAARPIDDLALVDTTPIFLDGHWYFFTTTLQPFMESLLFWSDQLEGPWKLHPASPISCSVRNSRGAGNLFWQDGRLFRPTQDCSISYGYGIRVNEIVRLTPAEFEERQAAFVHPSWAPGLIGTHTWNQSSRYQVIDGLRMLPREGT